MAPSAREGLTTALPVANEPSAMGALQAFGAVLMQLPPQSSVPGGQTRLHALDTQLRPAPQVTPHPPQLLESTRRSRHTPAQLVRPLAQLTTQLPPVQMVPAPHVTPHPPQFRRSVERSRHEPEQLVRPLAQLSMQLPPLQI